MLSAIRKLLLHRTSATYLTGEKPKRRREQQQQQQQLKAPVEPPDSQAGGDEGELAEAGNDEKCQRQSTANKDMTGGDEDRKEGDACSGDGPHKQHHRQNSLIDEDEDDREEDEDNEEETDEEDDDEAVEEDRDEDEEDAFYDEEDKEEYDDEVDAEDDDNDEYDDDDDYAINLTATAVSLKPEDEDNNEAEEDEDMEDGMKFIADSSSAQHQYQYQQHQSHTQYQQQQLRQSANSFSAFRQSLASSASTKRRRQPEPLTTIGHSDRVRGNLEELKVSEKLNDRPVVYTYSFRIADNRVNMRVFTDPDDRRIESIARSCDSQIRLEPLPARASATGSSRTRRVTIQSPDLHSLEKCCRLFDDKFPHFYVTGGLGLSNKSISRCYASEAE